MTWGTRGPVPKGGLGGPLSEKKIGTREKRRKGKEKKRTKEEKKNKKKRKKTKKTKRKPKEKKRLERGAPVRRKQRPLIGENPNILEMKSLLSERRVPCRAVKQFEDRNVSTGSNFKAIYR